MNNTWTPLSTTEIGLVQQWITTGISLDLTMPPPPAVFNNTSTVTTFLEDVRKRLNEYEDFGSIAPAPNKPITFIQPLHAIVREGKKPRIVINLRRNLNEYVRHQPFHYVTVDTAVALASHNSWFGKLDLTNCFISFPMNDEFIKYFTFQFEGQVRQFTHLPFGLSSAPWICSLLLAVPSFAIREQGIVCLNYLDDFLFIAQSAHDLHRALIIAIDIFQQLGLVINPTKVEGPIQRIIFLGVVIDSTTCTLECPAQRIIEISQLLTDNMKKSVIRLRSAQSIIGKLSFAAKVLPGARPFMRRLHDTVKTRLAHSEPHPAAAVRLNRAWRMDVQFWLYHLRDWNGKQHWRTSPSHPSIIATDASTVGFGFAIASVSPLIDSSNWPDSLRPGSGFRGYFAPCHAHLHRSHRDIGWSELFAVLTALRTYGPVLRNSSIIMMIDNLSGVFILNRQSARTPRLARLLRSIYSASLDFNIELTAKHIPGTDNILPDFLSRHQGGDTVGEWRRTHPQFADLLNVVSDIYSSTFLSPNEPK